MTDLLLTLQKGAQSLASAAKTFSLLPSDETFQASAWDSAGRMIENSWQEVGDVLYQALGENRQDVPHEGRNNDQK